MKALSNREAEKALNDAKRDISYAQAYIKCHDYYGRTDEANAKLEQAWALIYDVHRIVFGNHK